MIELNVNKKIHRLDVDPETPLLWVLRDELGLTGTKFSCGIGDCGACTVLLDGKATRSCVTSAADAQGKEITTIEGLSGPVADTLRNAWTEEDTPQCGYCQPGQIITAFELLKTNPNPSDSDIDEAMSGVFCRCGTYNEIRKAVRRAVGREGK